MACRQNLRQVKNMKVWKTTKPFHLAIHHSPLMYPFLLQFGLSVVALVPCLFSYRRFIHKHMNRKSLCNYIRAFALVLRILVGVINLKYHRKEPTFQIKCFSRLSTESALRVKFMKVGTNMQTNWPLMCKQWITTTKFIPWIFQTAPLIQTPEQAPRRLIPWGFLRWQGQY